MHWVDKKFRKHPEKFFFQSAMASLAILLILQFLDFVSQTAMIATLGASTFIIFGMPRSYSSRLRVLLGGYLVGMIVGITFSYFTTIPHIQKLIPLAHNRIYLFASFSVGTVLFLMSVLNVEHPPACGMTLGLVLNPWNVNTLLFLLVAVTVLALIKKFFHNHFVDLV